MTLTERFREILKFKEMIHSWTRKELRTRYKGSFLGFLWTFVNPLLQVIVYSVVFPFIMRFRQENFAMFLFTALVPWNFFTMAMQGSCGLMISNSSLVTKVYFPREVLPISYALSGLFNMIFSYMVVFPLLFVFRIRLSSSVLWLPVLMLILTVMCTGICMLISAVNVFFRDVEHMMSIIVMALYFLSPVIYNLSDLPDYAQRIMLLCNPMAGLLVLFRAVTFYGTDIDLRILILSACYAIVVLCVGYAVFLRLQRRFAEVL